MYEFFKNLFKKKDKEEDKYELGTIHDDVRSDLDIEKASDLQVLRCFNSICETQNQKIKTNRDYKRWSHKIFKECLTRKLIKKAK